MRSTLATLAADLAAGRTTSLQLVEQCLDEIGRSDGEGERTFIAVNTDGARATARAIDELRYAGAEPSRYAGIPISVKDLFDVRGQVTRAGSRALERPAAERDAAAVAALRAAGLVVIGRTNMTEFAFSGLGINPHFGTPANPWQRGERRIPGGSSSGAAVSVADGMAHAALGSDTGGSCRIPAALCGLVAFKPTQARVSAEGTVPLSPSLDTVGTIARSVDCCAILDALLTARRDKDLRALARAPRLAVVRGTMLERIDTIVEAAFERELKRLDEAGAELVELSLPELDRIPHMNASGGFAAAESFAWHRNLIARSAESYDPRVLARIRRGEHFSLADMRELRCKRAALIKDISLRLDGFDAFICPTVPIVAPPLEELNDDELYTQTNLLMLRNPTVVNLIDGCAISIPMGELNAAPTGLMVAGVPHSDQHILRTAKWIDEPPRVSWRSDPLRRIQECQGSRRIRVRSVSGP